MKREVVDRILSRFSNAPPVSDAVARCAQSNDTFVISKLRGSSFPALAAVLHQQISRPLLVITSTLDRAEALADSLTFFGSEPLLFPPFETLPFEGTEPVLHIAAERTRVQAELVELKQRKKHAPPVIVATADALLPRVLPLEKLGVLRVRIEWGDRIDLDELAEQLTALGYAREAMAESPGEFAIRGTIVDIFPADSDEPLRLDFLGDELESIRRFDPATQRSLPLDREIETIEILPRGNTDLALQHLAAGGPLVSFFDLLPSSTLLIVDGPLRVEQRMDYFDTVAARNWHEIHAHRHEGDDENFFIKHGLKPADWVMSRPEALEAMRRFQNIRIADLSLEEEGNGAEDKRTISIGAQSLETIPSNFKNFLDLIKEKQLEKYQIAIVCDNAGQAQRLDELLVENMVMSMIIDAPETPAAASRPILKAPISPEVHDVTIMTGELHEGFIFPAGKILLLTDREIFGRYQRRRIYRKAYHGKVIAGPSEIQRGDFVVHADHGIGQFEGIRRQTVDGRTSEFIEIVYQDGDKLLVPIEKLNLVQKYAAAEGKAPALDKLGQNKWRRRRSKAQEQVRKLAGELLELYARREAAERPSYGPDNVWQQEFEASFVYQETPDQIKAIRDVKADLAKPKPADRLICGDVGYGKTEVAIRAAFKVLTEGRQVAVLCPTTILAQQHFTTLTERLADFPFRVDVLSRFRSTAQQKETLDDLADGKVNLIVGTHRLLSKDVRFQNLGLLVIDEEQRFGVAQKERIKSFKTAIDVITLTATPIPRTLHLALSKLRDLSIIQTPPADRLPIKTRTIQFEKEHIEEAILRELNRGGQVFFVHNRIASIGDVARTIREIVPQARIAVAHGQMDEEALETIMIDFIAGKMDILISTAIIENGIDIPNVNTIIINRADMFGLAQLYQLRGRVGRDVRQAYAYLIVPQGQAITDTAMKRLAALEEFTELGMGFSIAMRDMEIRGTGNILGAEQSGAITDVGFDLYCRLLEEAVQELRGGVPAEALWPTEIKWPVDQWLPEIYVPIETQRIRIYKDLASARDADQLLMTEEELRDRYGPLPPEGENLLNAFRVKLALAPWRVDTVQGGGKGTIRIHAVNTRERGKDLARDIERLRPDAPWLDRVTYRSDGTITLYLSQENSQPNQTLGEFVEMLSRLPAPEPSVEAAADAQL